MIKIKHWVCDCPDAFIYPRTVEYCPDCRKIFSEEKTQPVKIDKLTGRNNEWFNLYLEGMTINRIAELYGRYPASVRSVINRYNIKIFGTKYPTELQKYQRDVDTFG